MCQAQTTQSNFACLRSSSLLFFSPFLTASHSFVFLFPLFAFLLHFLWLPLFGSFHRSLFPFFLLFPFSNSLFLPFSLFQMFSFSLPRFLSFFVSLLISLAMSLFRCFSGTLFYSFIFVSFPPPTPPMKCLTAHIAHIVQDGAQSGTQSGAQIGAQNGAQNGDQIGAQIGISTATIFTLVAFRFSLGHLTPQVSYFTRLDKFVLLSTILVFIALAGAVATVKCCVLLDNTELNRCLQFSVR